MTIESLLAETFPTLRPLRVSGRRSSWRLPLGPDDATLAGLKVDGAWASLQLEVRPVHEPDPFDALAEQAGWPGAVKHGSSGRRNLLRADVPLLTDTAAARAWLRRQLHWSAAGLLIAAQPATAQRATERAARSPGPSGEADPELLAHACASGGWNATVKPDGAVRIDVLLRGALRTVMLCANDAEIRASVSVAGGADSGVPGPCRTAAGSFLLRTSTALRWARPFVRRESDRFLYAGFECAIAPRPCEQALFTAIDALVAACELYGREAEVLLEHPEIATRYCERVLGMRCDGPDALSSAGDATSWPPTPLPAARAVGA
jgi:hypothetical protein